MSLDDPRFAKILKSAASAPAVPVLMKSSSSSQKNAFQDGNFQDIDLKFGSTTPLSSFNVQQQQNFQQLQLIQQQIQLEKEAQRLDSLALNLALFTSVLTSTLADLSSPLLPGVMNLQPRIPPLNSDSNVSSGSESPLTNADLSDFKKMHDSLQLSKKQRSSSLKMNNSNSSLNSLVQSPVLSKKFSPSVNTSNTTINNNNNNNNITSDNNSIISTSDTPINNASFIRGLGINKNQIRRPSDNLANLKVRNSSYSNPHSISNSKHNHAKNANNSSNGSSSNLQYLGSKSVPVSVAGSDFGVEAITAGSDVDDLDSVSSESTSGNLSSVNEADIEKINNIQVDQLTYHPTQVDTYSNSNFGTINIPKTRSSQLMSNIENPNYMASNLPSPIRSLHDINTQFEQNVEVQELDDTYSSNKPIDRDITPKISSTPYSITMQRFEQTSNENNNTQMKTSDEQNEKSLNGKSKTNSDEELFEDAFDSSTHNSSSDNTTGNNDDNSAAAANTSSVTINSSDTVKIGNRGIPSIENNIQSNNVGQDEKTRKNTFLNSRNSSMMFQFNNTNSIYSASSASNSTCSSSMDSPINSPVVSRFSSSLNSGPRPPIHQQQQQQQPRALLTRMKSMPSLIINRAHQGIHPALPLNYSSSGGSGPPLSQQQRVSSTSSIRSPISPQAQAFGRSNTAGVVPMNRQFQGVPILPILTSHGTPILPMLTSNGTPIIGPDGQLITSPSQKYRLRRQRSKKNLKTENFDNKENEDESKEVIHNAAGTVTGIGISSRHSNQSVTSIASVMKNNNSKMFIQHSADTSAKADVIQDESSLLFNIPFAASSTVSFFSKSATSENLAVSAGTNHGNSNGLNSSNGGGLLQRALNESLVSIPLSPLIINNGNINDNFAEDLSQLYNNTTEYYIQEELIKREESSLKLPSYVINQIELRSSIQNAQDSNSDKSKISEIPSEIPRISNFKSRSTSDLKLNTDIHSIKSPAINNELLLMSPEKLDCLSSTRPIWLPPKSPEEKLKHDHEITKAFEEYSKKEINKKEKNFQRLKNSLINSQKWFEITVKFQEVHRPVIHNMRHLCWKTNIPNNLKYKIYTDVLQYYLSKKDYVTRFEKYSDLEEKLKSIKNLNYLEPEIDLIILSLYPKLGFYQKGQQLNHILKKMFLIMKISKQGLRKNDEILIPILLLFFTMEQAFTLINLLNEAIFTEIFIIKLDNNLTANPVMRKYLYKHFKDEMESLTSERLFRTLMKINPILVIQMIDFLILNNNYKILYCFILLVLKFHHFGFVDLEQLVLDDEMFIFVDDHEEFLERFHYYYKKF